MEKNLGLVILGIIAILAIIGMLLLFKGQGTGEFIRYEYPTAILQAPAPGEVGMKVPTTPVPGEYFAADEPARSYGNTLACEDQIKYSHKIPQDFTWEVYSEEQMLERGSRYCMKAPEAIAPIKYCCMPQKP